MSMMRTRRSGIFALVGLGCVVGVTGCHAGGSGALGAGPTVNACDGVSALNALPEPDVADRAGILAYSAGAVRVIDRIDTGERVQTLNDAKAAVPDSVVAALKAEKTSYVDLSSKVSSATSATQLHQVVTDFTNSPTFAGADSTVELWAGNECG